MATHVIPADEVDEHQAADDCPCRIRLVLVADVDAQLLGIEHVHRARDERGPSSEE